MTVHDLAADWAWMNDAEGFRLKGGSVVWEVAQYGPKGGLAVLRLEVTPEGLRQHRRYVDPDVEVELVTDGSEER